MTSESKYDILAKWYESAFGWSVSFTNKRISNWYFEQKEMQCKIDNPLMWKMHIAKGTTLIL